ncbi:hypothetical protein KQX54_002522 [Cotesia glomerata]|uniref:Uncharacterized protein n=1 Tax=Cotesia glomerata TaxID=32391 RepID=A0AAV7IC26_COTGL|nr:hypothetical protein KQX54_002522 [Cotesia glomerata]
MALPNLNVDLIISPVEWEIELTNFVLMDVMKLALQRQFILTGNLNGAKITIPDVSEESVMILEKIVWFKVDRDSSTFPYIISREELFSSGFQEQLVQQPNNVSNDSSSSNSRRSHNQLRINM